jgi:hypothetical protein
VEEALVTKRREAGADVKDLLASKVEHIWADMRERVVGDQGHMLVDDRMIALALLGSSNPSLTRYDPPLKPPRSMARYKHSVAEFPPQRL